MGQSDRQSAAWYDRQSSVVVPFPVPKSDEGLVKALRAGYPEAVRALNERHSAELLRIAARILGPDATLCAVVTDAIRRALADLEELEDPTRLRLWLTSRVVTACRARLRWRRYFGWITAGKAQSQARAAAPRPSGEQEQAPDASSYSEQMLAAYRVLDRIGDKQRILFCLVVIHAMSLAEVTTVLGLSLISARTVLDGACRDFARLSENEPSISRLRLRSA